MPRPSGIEAAVRQTLYWWDLRLRALRGQPKRRIVYLHVPKCAGTTLTQAIAAHYPPHLVARLQTSPSASIAGATGRKLEAFRQRLLWYLARSKDCEFVSGHVNYSTKMFNDLRPRWSFITLLRDPVDRFLSSYFYRLHKETSHAALEMKLERYVETRRARHAGAIYVRFFAGDGRREPSPQRIDKAIRNLERLQLVGITERMDAFAQAFEQRFGHTLSLGHRNQSPVSRERTDAEVPASIRARIADLCAPDRQVYEHVCRHLVEPPR